MKHAARQAMTDHDRADHRLPPTKGEVRGRSRLLAAPVEYHHSRAGLHPESFDQASANLDNTVCEGINRLKGKQHDSCGT
jgi:hypothetical protein